MTFVDQVISRGIKCAVCSGNAKLCAKWFFRLRGKKTSELPTFSHQSQLMKEMIRPNRPRIQNRIGDRKRLLSSNILHMKRRTIPNASSHNSKFQHLTVNWTTRQAAKSSLPNALQDHILHQCQNGVTFARLRSAAPTAALWKKYWMNVVHSNRMGEMYKLAITRSYSTKTWS